MKTIFTPLGVMAILVYLVASGSSYSSAAEGSNPSEGFLPSAQLGIDAGYYFSNPSDLSGFMSRSFIFDIYKRHDLTWAGAVRETTYLGNNNGRKYTPVIIRYKLDYTTLEYTTGNGTVLATYDHICNNAIDSDSILMHNNWYRLGAGWKTSGIDHPLKKYSSDIWNNSNISFINNIEAEVTFGKIFRSLLYEYKYIATGKLRYDIFSFYGLIPYLRADFTGYYDNNISFDRSLEYGVMLPFSKTVLIPYVRREYRIDIDQYNGRRGSFTVLGLRMESDFETKTESVKKEKHENKPELHMTGSYARYIEDKTLLYHADLLLQLDIATIKFVTPFVNSRLEHDSLVVQNSMWPRYLIYSEECGTSLKASPALVCDLFYNRIDAHDGDTYRGYHESINRAAIRLCSENMKPGKAFPKPERLFNYLGYSVESGVSYIKENYPSKYDLAVSLAWHIINIEGFVPYTKASAKFYYHKTQDAKVSFEAGISRPAKITAGIFYRFTTSDSRFDTNRSRNYYHLIGVSIDL